VSHRRPESIEIEEYDSAWPEEYERLKARVLNVLGDLVVRVEHVGSTAVPGLAAKSIIDLYAVVADLDRASERLATVGYAPEGDLGVPGRLGFAWPPDEKRHHLYLCTADHAGLERVVRFRDYMRANPDEVLAYGELKRELAAQHRNERDAYAEGKGPFIEAALERSRVRA
jgi:GrpB-like predicted nucleotidyltransferase (UPF0157 family)